MTAIESFSNVLTLPNAEFVSSVFNLKEKIEKHLSLTVQSFGLFNIDKVYSFEFGRTPERAMVNTLNEDSRALLIIYLRMSELKQFNALFSLGNIMDMCVIFAASNDNWLQDILHQSFVELRELGRELTESLPIIHQFLAQQVEGLEKAFKVCKAVLTDDIIQSINQFLRPLISFAVILKHSSVALDIFKSYECLSDLLKLVSRFYDVDLFRIARMAKSSFSILEISIIVIEFLHLVILEPHQLLEFGVESVENADEEANSLFAEYCAYFNIVACKSLSNDGDGDDDALQHLSALISKEKQKNIPTIINGGKTAKAKSEGKDKSDDITVQISLISAVKDLFPELGEGFIEECLKDCQYSSEKVINMILEDSFNKRLRSLRRDLPLPSHETATILPSHSLSTRQEENILDKMNALSLPSSDTISSLSSEECELHLHRPPRSTLDYIMSDEEREKILNTAYEEDDEYDDTYDDAIEDPLKSITESDEIVVSKPAFSSTDPIAPHLQTFYRAWINTPNAFERSAAARRSKERKALLDATKLTHEQIEGWALRFADNPRRNIILKDFAIMEKVTEEDTPENGKSPKKHDSVQKEDYKGRNERGRDRSRGRGHGYHQRGKSHHFRGKRNGDGMEKLY